MPPDAIDPQAAVPAEPASEPKPGTPEADAEAIAMFDAAMAGDADATPLPEGEPPDKIVPAAKATPAEGETPPEGEAAPEGEVPPVVDDGTPPAEEGSVPAKAPVEAAKPGDDAAAKAQIEAEIKERGLKGDTATRFRELSNQVRELSVLREEAPVLREKARLQEQWQGIVAESTATAPQLEQALAYIQSVNSGDPERLGIAAKAMLEVKWAYNKLGWELPGVVDPLEKHADLIEAVNDGDMTRKGALEVAASRAREAVSTARTQTKSKEDEYAEALDAVGPQIDALSARLKASDPAFLAKLPHLKPTVDLIKQTLHPSRWPQAIERAYKALPTPAPTPRPASVKPMPLRPTGGGNSAAATVRKFTPEQVAAGDPFDMGVREASGQ